MLEVFAAAGGGDEGGSFLVNPNGGLMIWTLLVFAISIYVLGKLAFPKIAEALDKRQKMIEDSIDHAEATRKEADEVLAEYRSRLSSARSQADEIVARARRTGENVEAEAVAEGKRKREEMLDQTRKEITSETNRALGGIRTQVADLTVVATEKVTKRSLTGEDQQRLVEDALAELDFTTLAGDRAEA